jgi:membrane-associated phospholipid phosphatase
MCNSNNFKVLNVRYFIYTFLFLLSFNSTSYSKSNSVKEAGDIFRYLAPMSAAIGSLYIKDYRGVGELAVSVFLTQGISELSKKAFPTKRPDWKHGCPKNSFPSGHVASTFSAASYLRIRYNNPNYYVPAYTIAVFTAYSRVQAKRHRVVDVFTAAALAEIVSYFVVSANNDMQVIPYAQINKDNKIFGLNYKF